MLQHWSALVCTAQSRNVIKCRVKIKETRSTKKHQDLAKQFEALTRPSEPPLSSSAPAPVPTGAHATWCTGPLCPSRSHRKTGSSGDWTSHNFTKPSSDLNSTSKLQASPVLCGESVHSEASDAVASRRPRSSSCVSKMGPV